MHTRYFVGMFRTLITLILLMFVSGLSFAALDNKGTDFIVAFNPNFSPPEIELHLTGDTSTSVTINYPVNSPTFVTTVGIVPGSVTIVTLPANAAQDWVANSTLNNAVRAFGDEEFVVYLINRASFTSDAALALPIDTMNTEYLVSDYNPAFFGSQFTVYAAFDNTTVTITPTTALVGRAAGVPFDVVLNRGEGYYALGASTLISNTLTGTEIVSDLPVGVVNGNGCTQVPLGTAACDHIFEVAQPVQSWGESALVGNLPNRPNGSIYRILASEDGTIVSQDNVAIGSLNRGEFIETASLAGDHLFSANKPIYVTQFMTGVFSSGATLGDPAMGNMIPSEQYLSDYTFSTVGDAQFVENYVTIVAEDSDIATLTLDGLVIGAGAFTPIASSGFSVARLPLGSGTHTTSSVGGHGITVEGYNSADSYIYPGGALFQFINPVGDANEPVCTGQTMVGPPPSFSGFGEDSRPSEDINGNGILDPGEDLNSNGNIDVDTGVFFVELMAGASNLSLLVSPFVPGDGLVSYSVELVDSNVSGIGTVIITDGAGNTCEQPIELIVEVPPQICDVDVDGDVDRDDIGLIFAARNQLASGPDDPRDSDGDGIITVLDGRLCSQQCTLASCEVE